MALRRPASLSQTWPGVTLKSSAGFHWPAIQAADQGNVPQERAEEFHQVEHQRRGRRPRLVIEPQGRLQADRQQGAVDERLEQGIAEAQQAVEAVAGRTAIAAVGPKLLGQAAVDQHPQAIEIGPGGGPFQSQERGGRFRLGHVGQHAAHLVQAGAAPGAVGNLLAACPQNVAALRVDFRLDQAAGQIEPHGRIGQYTGLADPAMRLDLARRLVAAKIETQRRYVLRASREEVADRAWCRPRLDQIRGVLADVPKAGSAATLLGLEGTAARAYFDCLRVLIASGLPEELRPDGRNRRPPRDRFNCLLSFGYALLQSLVHRTLLAVGLEPALGFYHQPRTAAPPLVLDVMELFRTLLWDIPLIGSLNRGQWEPAADFSVTPGQVWLSDAGRRKAIELFEQRLTESYQHPHTGQSLSYARIVELEARLLEKEWTGCPGLFARLRLR